MRLLVSVAVMIILAQPVRAQLAGPNDLGVAFGHVHLSVADVGVHQELWTRLFHAVPAEKAGFSAVRIPGTLVFFTEREATAPSRATAMDHVGFAVRDLDAVLAGWRALGHEVDDEVVAADAVATAYITLPDGITLELREDPDLTTTAAIHHVHFFSPRPDELRDWYADVFSATTQSTGDPGASARVPGSRLRFAESDAARSRTHETAIDHIGFEVHDIDGFVERLERRGVELESRPFYVERLDLWVAFFTDPAGVRVEVTEGLDGY